jgi:hypothetical protein
MVKQPIAFQFYRSVPHTIGQLRQFSFQLVQMRKADQSFSSKLRSNKELPWAKLWNEELAPLIILANLLKCDDEAKVIISAEASPGPDAYLNFDNLELRIQITISDPDWGGDGKGGYINFLQNEVLCEGGVAWGGGGTEKNNGRIVSNPRVLNPHERISACRQGIWNALERKAKKIKDANLLLVYARDYLIQTIDEGFQSVIAPVIESFLLQEIQFDFERIVFVTDYDGPYFDWNRNGK